MAEIIQFTAGRQSLRLYDEQFGRRMEIGCAWGKIRVLVRFTVEATSTINSSGLVVGVSQGTTDMFRSANCTDFIGANFGNTLQATTWTYNAGPPAYASSGGLTPIAVRKIGASTTTVPPGGGINVYTAISPTRGVFGCDIEKSDGAMKVKPLGCGTIPLAQTDFNFGNLYYNADNDLSTTALIGHSPNVVTVPYSGQYAFDSVNIDWNNGIQPLVVNDILVVRFF